MQRFTEEQIRGLHSAFRSQKKYNDKLAFFDRTFGIVPFAFPKFDSSLGFFFIKEKTEILAAIFKMERNNPELVEKKFSFGETYAFSIRPANSNSAAFSSYILSRFLSDSPEFDELICLKKNAGKSIEAMLDEANGIVNHIEFSLQNEYDKSFKLQCMSVFYKGFNDAFRKQVALPGKKRKFTELYLYAQGIIYAHYIRFLKNDLFKSGNQADLSDSLYLDFSGKLALLNELGILDFLRKKFSRMDPLSFENKIAEFIRLITGEQRERKEILLLFQESEIKR